MNKRRSVSALNANGNKLFKDVVHFIQHANSIISLSFDSVELPLEILYLLSKSLLHAHARLSWLNFSNCNIGGDDGLKVIARMLSSIPIQVLGLERCGLTDDSLPIISNILKVCDEFHIFPNSIRLSPTT